jgi:hypothetical protein
MSYLNQRLPSVDLLHQAIKSASEGWYIGDSEIAGQGVFAGKDYQPGDVIGMAMTCGSKDEYGAQCWNLTTLARYCNHQQKNNVEIKKKDNQFDLIATKPISTDDELVADYRQVTRAVGPYSRMQWEGKDVPTNTLDEYTEK